VGRGKHCTPERKELIKKLIQDGKTYKEVEKLGCFSKLISNALKYEKKMKLMAGNKYCLLEQFDALLNSAKIVLWLLQDKLNKRWTLK